MITIKCEKEVAYDSPDHLIPRGTAHDNSVNQRFNNKLYNLYDWSNLSVLDLGCSGGGFVRNCIDDGFLAVGLEGSDYSKKLGRAEWKTIPNYLFICDITKKFQLYKNSERAKFSVITAWEVMEHIPKDGLHQLIENVKNHMEDGALWIMSVATTPDIYQGVNLHQTTESKEWWVKLFAEHGLIRAEAHERYFNSQYVRGKFDTKDNFHLVLTNSMTNTPKPKNLPLRTRFLDIWLGSTPQHLIKSIITGDD